MAWLRKKEVETGPSPDEIATRREYESMVMARRLELFQRLEAIKASAYSEYAALGDDILKPRTDDELDLVQLRTIAHVEKISRPLVEYKVGDPPVLSERCSRSAREEVIIDNLAGRILDGQKFTPLHTRALNDLAKTLGEYRIDAAQLQSLHRRVLKHAASAVELADPDACGTMMAVSQKICRRKIDLEGGRVHFTTGKPVRDGVYEALQKMVRIERGAIAEARSTNLQPIAQYINTALKKGKVAAADPDLALFMQVTSVALERVEQLRATAKDKKVSQSDRTQASAKKVALSDMLDQLSVLIREANEQEESIIKNTPALETDASDAVVGPATPRSYVDLDRGIAVIVRPSKLARVQRAATILGAGAAITTGLANPAAADTTSPVYVSASDAPSFTDSVPLDVVTTSTETAPSSTETSPTFEASDTTANIPDGVPHVASSMSGDVAIETVRKQSAELRVSAPGDAERLSMADEIFQKASASLESKGYKPETGEGYLAYQQQMNNLIDQLMRRYHATEDTMSDSEKLRFSREIAWARLLMLYPQIKSAGLDPTVASTNFPDVQNQIQNFLESQLGGIRQNSSYTPEDMQAVEMRVGSAYVILNKDRIPEVKDAIEQQQTNSGRNNHGGHQSGSFVLDKHNDAGEFDNGRYRATYMFWLNKGFTLAGATGPTANAAWESGMNPRKVQGGAISPELPGDGFTGGYGYYQYTYSGYKDMLRAKAAEMGRSTGDPLVQNELAWDIMQGMPDLLHTLRTTNDYGKATRMFMEVFEKPGIPHLENRLALADKIFDANTRPSKSTGAADTKPHNTHEATHSNAGHGGGLEGQILNYPGVDKIVSRTDTNVPLPDKLGNVVYFSQWDKRWYNKAYNPAGITGRTMASSGCGPTTQAMAISTVTNKHVNPYEMAVWNQQHGYRIDGGTSHAAFVASAEAFGASAQQIPNTAENITQALKNGKLVIVNGQDSQPDTPATSSGHIYLVRGLDKDGNFLVSDANSISKSLRSYTPAEIASVSTVAVAVW